MLIAPIRARTPTPLWSINILIYCTHMTKIERLLTHFLLCVCGCAHVHLPLYTHTHTPQEVPSNPLHYITNNHSCFHERNHISLLNSLYIMYICVYLYQLMFYIYKRLYIHSFVKPQEHLHLPNLLFSTYGETFLLFHFLFQQQLTLWH